MGKNRQAASKSLSMSLLVACLYMFALSQSVKRFILWSILICMGVYIPHRLSTALQEWASCPSTTNVYALTNPAHWPYGVRTAPNHPYPTLQCVKSFTHTNQHSTRFYFYRNLQLYPCRMQLLIRHEWRAHLKNEYYFLKKFVSFSYFCAKTHFQL